MADPLADEDICSVLQAANRAPSAGDLQAYRIVVVTNAQLRACVATAALGQEFVGEAPVVLVFCAVGAESAKKYHERGALYSVQDATIACAYAQLECEVLGLGSCWVGAFHENDVEEALNLPSGWRPVALLPLGKRKMQHHPRNRKKLEDLVVWKK